MIARRRTLHFVPTACGLPSALLGAPTPMVVGILNPFSRSDAGAGFDRFEREMLKDPRFDDGHDDANRTAEPTHQADR
jgi:hypothetical protein